MTGSANASRRSIRVLSLPGRHFRGNPYFKLFCGGIGQAGAGVVDIKSAAAARLAFDIVHVHFPEHYVTEQGFVGAIKWTSLYTALFIAAKIAGRSIVWSVHDVHPFKERHAWLLRPYMRLFRRLVDAHVFLTPSSRLEFYATFPEQSSKPSVIVPHGPYPVMPPHPVAVENLRGRLGVTGCFTIGFLGAIKAYKNIAALSALPSHLRDGTPVKIIVAGSPDSETAGLTKEVCGNLSGDTLVRLDERLSDSELDLLVRACDCVLLPYLKGWNSGMAMLVLSNGGRIIGSPLDVFGDLASEFRPPWAYQYQTTDELPALLDQIAATPIKPRDEVALRQKLDQMSFARGGRSLVEFYSHLRAR